MKIGIIGAGPVAQSLAAAFTGLGHEVLMGTGSPGKLAEWQAAHPTVQVGSMADAAGFGDVVALAVKATAAIEVLRNIGPQRLAGKTVIDANNPIADTPPVNGVLNYFTGPNDSLMEQLQRAAPEARFVKAFNSVGNPFFAQPAFAGGRPTMFICGNHAAAKATVAELLEALGWDSADMGAVESARAIEPLAMLWCIPGLLRNEWTHAFKLLKAA